MRVLRRFWYRGLSPEIVYFRIASDGMDAYEFAPADWYIRGAECVQFTLVD
jgi:mannosyl-oligosaccharide alpha-1,2-mannosidase